MLKGGSEMKRLFIILFLGIVFLVGCNNKDNLEKTDDVSETEEYDATISGNIPPNEFRISDKPFSIIPGKEVLHVIATWNPLGASVRFGFIDAKTKKEFWDTSQVSDSWNGTVETTNLKEGEYYIAVKAGPEDVYFDENDRILVAHFKWE